MNCMDRLKDLFSKARFVLIPLVVGVGMYFWWQFYLGFERSQLYLWISIFLIAMTLFIKGLFAKLAKRDLFWAIILSLVLTPVIYLGIYLGALKYNEVQALKALDVFIQEVAATGTVPPGFEVAIEYRVEEDINLLEENAEEGYEIIYVDYVVGAYDVVVEFENGEKCVFMVAGREGDWRIYFLEWD